MSMTDPQPPQTLLSKPLLSSLPTFNELRLLKMFQPSRSLYNLFLESYRQRLKHLSQFRRKDFNFLI